MKHVLVILDGAADEPLPQLEGRTPLMVAATPNLRDMARRGRIGAARTLYPEWEADPEAALMAVLGYDPAGQFQGRGPIEAASMEIDLDRRDLAFRMDLVTTDGERLLDPTAGRIGAAEGGALVRHLAERLRIRTIQFYPGRGYRHVLVWRDGPLEVRTRNPRELAGERVRAALPEGDRAEKLQQVMWDSHELLSEHPVNRRRGDAGKPPANMVWPWSGGRMPRLPGFGAVHGLGGAMVAGTDLARGLGRLVGLEVVDVPGATGYLDTDYAAKARAALSALERFDFAAVHVEAPNEAGLDGDYEAKVDALERVDERLLGTLLDRIGKLDDFRIMVIPDHATSSARRRALPGWVPFLLAGNLVKPSSQRLPFDERAADEATWRVDEPWHTLPALFEE